jgi:nucleoside-triphosphatase THEP1
MGMMRKAQRRKAKLRLGISGPAGSGKTFSSLLLAYGITGDWEKICLIDTENFSGDLYANYQQNGIEIGEYNIINLTAPYTPEKYTAAIKECEEAGIECIIIDSLTHAWAGDGGLLDKKGQIEKKTGNGWTAWRDITPMHNRLVETLLQSPCHIISTLRAKMDYVQEKNEQGKTVIRKIGMNPIQREGMEYEFTVFIDVDQDHNATTTKDRTSLLDGTVFRPGIDTGKTLLKWLENGTDAPQPKPLEVAKEEINWKGFWASVKALGLTSKEVHETAGTDDLNTLTRAQVNELYKKLSEAKKGA